MTGFLDIRASKNRVGQKEVRRPNATWVYKLFSLSWFTIVGKGMLALISSREIWPFDLPLKSVNIWPYTKTPKISFPILLHQFSIMTYQCKGIQYINEECEDLSVAVWREKSSNWSEDSHNGNNDGKILPGFRFKSGRSHELTPAHSWKKDEIVTLGVSSHYQFSHTLLWLRDKNILRSFDKFCGMGFNEQPR